MKRFLPLLLLPALLLGGCAQEESSSMVSSSSSSTVSTSFSSPVTSSEPMSSASLEESSSSSSSVFPGSSSAASSSAALSSSLPDREEPFSPPASAALPSSSEEPPDLQPEEKKVCMVFTFMDSNGFALADEEVEIQIGEYTEINWKTYEKSVLTTDANGRIEVATGYYPSICTMELINFDHSLRPQPEGLGLGPLMFEYRITEFTDTVQEETYTVDVYPLEK